jgi:MFS family permease
MKTPVFHPSWWVILAGVCAALHIAKLSPALPALQQALQISLVQAGFLLSAVQMASMTLGLVVGLSADSVGLRRCMLAGLLLLSVAGFWGGFVAHAEILLLLRVIEGLGFLMTVMPAPALIRRTCLPDQLSGRMGWWGTYMPFGSACALLVGPVWIAAWGWQVWWWALAGMTTLAAWAVWRCVPTVQAAHDIGGATWANRLRMTLVGGAEFLRLLIAVVGRGGIFADRVWANGIAGERRGCFVCLGGGGQCVGQHWIWQVVATRLVGAEFAAHRLCGHGLGGFRRFWAMARLGTVHPSKVCVRGDVFRRRWFDSGYFVFDGSALGAF